MAVCVGCGLKVTGGLLEVEVDPAGGVVCGDNGLSVAAAIAAGDDDAMAAAAAAHSAANEADDTADAAQSTANAASASAAYRARLFGSGGDGRAGNPATQSPVDLAGPPVNTPLLIQGGTYTGTTNGSGDIIVNFPNPFPTACIAVTANTGAVVFDGFIGVHDSGGANQVSMRVYDGSGTPAASTVVRLTYIAIGY